LGVLNVDLLNAPTRFNLTPEKIQVEIEALFQLLMVYTDTKKYTHYCKINTLIALLRILNLAKSKCIGIGIFYLPNNYK